MSTSLTTQDNLKMVRLAQRELKSARNHELLMATIQNPVLEIIAGFVAVDYLRHTPIRHTYGNGVDFWEYAIGNTAANWCEIGIFLSVAAQQMKNNPAAAGIASQSVQAVGGVAAAGVNAVGNILKGFGGVFQTLIAGLGAMGL